MRRGTMNGPNRTARHVIPAPSPLAKGMATSADGVRIVLGSVRRWGANDSLRADVEPRSMRRVVGHQVAALDSHADVSRRPARRRGQRAAGTRLRLCAHAGDALAVLEENGIERAQSLRLRGGARVDPVDVLLPRRRRTWDVRTRWGRTGAGTARSGPTAPRFDGLARGPDRTLNLEPDQDPRSRMARSGWERSWRGIHRAAFMHAVFTSRTRPR